MQQQIEELFEQADRTLESFRTMTEVANDVAKNFGGCRQWFVKSSRPDGNRSGTACLERMYAAIDKVKAEQEELQSLPSDELKSWLKSLASKPDGVADGGTGNGLSSWRELDALSEKMTIWMDNLRKDSRRKKRLEHDTVFQDDWLGDLKTPPYSKQIAEQISESLRRERPQVIRRLKEDPPRQEQPPENAPLDKTKKQLTNVDQPIAASEIDNGTYVPFSVIMTEHLPEGVFPTEKQLKNYLSSHSDRIKQGRPANPDGNPRRNRFVVHVVDWIRERDVFAYRWKEQNKDFNEPNEHQKLAEKKRQSAIDETKKKAGSRKQLPSNFPPTSQ